MAILPSAMLAYLPGGYAKALFDVGTHRDVASLL